MDVQAASLHVARPPGDLRVADQPRAGADEDERDQERGQQQERGAAAGIRRVRQRVDADDVGEQHRYAPNARRTAAPAGANSGDRRSSSVSQPGWTDAARRTASAPAATSPFCAIARPAQNSSSSDWGASSDARTYIAVASSARPAAIASSASPASS